MMVVCNPAAADHVLELVFTEDPLNRRSCWLVLQYGPLNEVHAQGV